jgi:hypothetical protein
MRPFGLAVTLTIAAAGASAQTETQVSAREYEQRIQKLEDRVAFLERALTEVLSKTPQVAAAPDVSSPAVNHLQSAPAVRLGGYEPPPELIPEIGKIGAQVGLWLGASGSPFRLGSGSLTGGYIDLPLIDRPAWLHGKLSYEISIGMTQSRTTFNTTSNVAQVANLAVLNTLNPNGGLANVTAAVTGTGPAPFPVTTSTQTRLRLLQVNPFGIKYSSTLLDRWRLRPYATAAFGVYVTIHNQNPALGTPASFGVRPDANIPPDILAAVKQIFGGQAPFGGPLVAGQISQSPELEARGLPGGHGNLDLGGHASLGMEYRLTRTFSLGFDTSFHKIAGTYGFYRTYGSRFGIYF